MGVKNLVMTREDAIKLIDEYISSINIKRHCIATEAVMRSLARKFGEDENKWGIAGLLHDLDVEITRGDLTIHGLKTLEILKSYNIDDEICRAILMHNEIASGKKRSEKFHYLLASAETLTGLIVATALVCPSKKLADVSVKSVKNRMKEKSFARKVNREIIMECEKAGLLLDEFIEIALGAMKDISSTLGL